MPFDTSKMIRCRNQQHRNDHYCVMCGRRIRHEESYWRDTDAEIICDACVKAKEQQK